MKYFEITQFWQDKKFNEMILHVYENYLKTLNVDEEIFDEQLKQLEQALPHVRNVIEEVTEFGLDFRQ